MTVRSLFCRSSALAMVLRIAIAGVLLLCLPTSKAALVSDQCSYLEDIYSNNGIRVVDVGFIVRVDVINIGPGEYFTDWWHEVFSWNPMTLRWDVPQANCRIRERYGFPPPAVGLGIGGFTNAGANSAAGENDLSEAAVLTRFFPTNPSTPILRSGFSLRTAELVRNRALLKDGFVLTTSSPAFETFSAKPTSAPSSLPFIVEASAPGDRLVVYANDQPVFSQDLTAFAVGDLVFAKLPPLTASPTGGSLLSVWIHSAGGAQSSVWFPGVALDPNDVDRDGVPNAVDLCPSTALSVPVDSNGCSVDQRDSDNDGVNDSRDLCPATPLGSSVDTNGCALVQLDSDGDGVSNAADACPNTPVGAPVDGNGCSAVQRDTDGDGVTDSADQCPNTPPGAVVNAGGCALSQVDTDGDGVRDDSDACPGTTAGTAVDTRGCPVTPPVRQACDVNGDRFIDYRDVGAILSSLGRLASGASDPRDSNADGRITVLDAALCTKRCERRFCLPPK